LEILKAPEFSGVVEWINSSPLSMEDLRGKVVMVDFWTYSCVNCLRTLPHHKSLYAGYRDNGFVIIGVHTPEFEFEKDPKNVRDAVKRLGIEYPVAVDSNYAVWYAYNNQYWPHLFLIDDNGGIRYDHSGEGGYARTEEKVVELLREGGLLGKGAAEKDANEIAKEEILERVYSPSHITPETYLGGGRSEGFGNFQACVPGSCIRFIDVPHHMRNKVYLSGDWIQEDEFLRKGSDVDGYLLLKYFAGEVNLVMEIGLEGVSASAEMLLDGRPLTTPNKGKDVMVENGVGKVVVDRPDIYNLVRTKESEEHEVKILPNSQQLRLFAFTFG
jgi:thiol-disulfide isomerase/thioredoxin